MSEYIECPQCGKKTIVQRQEDLYQCLACDFKRDFSLASKSKPQPKSDKGVFWLSIAAATIAFFLVRVRNPVPNTPSFQVQSSPTSTAVVPENRTE